MNTAPSYLAALQWITTILQKLNISFQVAGGLAASAYGAVRPLNDIDIDIPESAFELLVPHVEEFITFGPEHFKDTQWDLMLMTLDYQGISAVPISANCIIASLNSGKLSTLIFQKPRCKTLWVYL